MENGRLIGLREENDIKDMKVPPGRNIKCNIDALIEEVYVSTTAADWFYDLVQSVYCKYGNRKEIKRSDLAFTPPR
jgi:hypothetical protein